MKRKSIWLTILLVSIQWAVFHPQPIGAQITTGTIVGTVTDTTGAVIPGITITVRNINTGLTRSLLSDDFGDYSTTLLPLGVYEVTAELPGFKQTQISGILVKVDQRQRIDIIMEIGEQTESILVEAEAPMMSTERADIGMLVDNQKVVELPLKGRVFYDLNLLDSGTAQRSNHRNSIVRWLNVPFSYNGSSPDGNQFLVDGISIQDPLHTYATLKLSIDAIQEFKQAASQYSAEFGHGSGAQVNVVTKSGTNRFHGNVFWFGRRDRFNSRNFFDETRSERQAQGLSDLPQFRLNQYGGTFGGPISEDKTFFFVSYEGNRILKGQTKRYSVPPVAMRNGNFVGSPTIYDPETTRDDPNNPGGWIRDPFPGNIIPADRIDQVSKDTMDFLFPLPSAPGESSNLLASPVEDIKEDQITVRLDHQLNDQHSFYGRYTYQEPRRLILSFSQLPNFFENYDHPVTNAVISWTSVFGTSTINEFKLGWMRFIQEHTDDEADRDIPAELGISRLDSQFGGPPTIAIAGFNNTAGISNTPNNRVGNVPTIQNNFSFTRGRHSIGAGVDFRQRQQNKSGIQPNPRGRFNFSTRFTSLDGVTAGHAMADYLLGFPQSTSGGIGNGFRHYRGNDLGLYIQDDWQIHPNLTLNLGLRYERYGPWYEIRDALYYFDIEQGDSVSTEEFMSRGFPRSSYFADNSDFAPRLGLAWRPFGGNKTVVRAGYGMYHFRGQGYGPLIFALNPSPLTERLGFNSDLRTPDLTLANGFPLALAAESKLAFSTQADWKTPYNQVWSLFIQREVARNLTVEVGYLGNHGTNLTSTKPLARAPAGPGALVDKRPYPDFAIARDHQPWGDSIYHALKVNLERRFHEGVSFRFSWTYSKTLETAGVGSFGESLPQIKRDFLDHAQNKGRTQFDARNRVSLSYSWDLPFGRGKQFGAGATGFWNGLISNWQFNGITILQSGTPLDTSLVIDNANTGAGGGDDYPDRVGDPNSGPQTVEQFFNTGAFALGEQFAFGDSGKYLIDVPGTINFDMSIFKNIPLGETQMLQLRLEVFNIFNHANFDPPNGQFGTGNFGKIFSAGDGRELQFAVKYSF